MSNKESYVVCHEFDRKKIVIYHSLHNQPQQIEFENENDKIDFLSAISEGYVKTDVKSIDAITHLSDEEARIVLSKKKLKYLDRNRNIVNFLSLITVENCNLNCSYCIMGINIRAAKKKKNTFMSWEIAQKALDWYFSIPRITNQYYVNFSGGEPLINKQVVIQAIEYIRSRKYKNQPEITINTNATLIDDYLADFFAANQVEIATSLDGTPNISDKVRITKKVCPHLKK